MKLHSSSVVDTLFNGLKRRSARAWPNRITVQVGHNRKQLASWLYHASAVTNCYSVRVLPFPSQRFTPTKNKTNFKNGALPKLLNLNLEREFTCLVHTRLGCECITLSDTNGVKHSTKCWTPLASCNRVLKQWELASAWLNVKNTQTPWSIGPNQVQVANRAPATYACHSLTHSSESINIPICSQNQECTLLGQRNLAWVQNKSEWNKNTKPETRPW